MSGMVIQGLDMPDAQRNRGECVQFGVFRLWNVGGSLVDDNDHKAMDAHPQLLLDRDVTRIRDLYPLVNRGL